jgi:hypothetical protein
MLPERKIRFGEWRTGIVKPHFNTPALLSGAQRYKYLCEGL